ncbi:hypothetical protein L195_g015258 [Trifolium pratense]|uniref:F-box domain-containing protein n=1 Tax=Trifolium pratense TaxID=57577 RepID=A0A2K3MMX1_TRIPR|nr:hypothetical protein L195_g015258 [Trifolium pratense]
MDRVVMRPKRFKSINNCSHSDSDDDQCSNGSSSSSSNNKSFILFAELSQDLMLYILTLLPLKCLLNSARYVSKFWATSISAYLPLKPPGLYVFNANSTIDSYFLNIQDHVNGQPERIALGTPSRMGRVMATCHGILLLCTFYTLAFAVNPILKCCFRIPSLPTNSKMYICYRSTIARVPRTAKVKLFVTDVLNVSGVNWDGVTVMDVDREIIIREYPIPPRGVDAAPPAGAFLWMGDRLSCIVLAKGISRTYQIYALDLDLGKWNLYHEMGPFDYGANCGHKLDNDQIMSLMFRFWINDQIFFIALIGPPKNLKSFPGITNIIFCYNVKTRQLIKIDDSGVGDFQALLHSNTLVSFPSTPT